MTEFRLRVVYGKTGRLSLLSHLEVARALERAVRRSGLPFALTQGRPPRMKISFGSALPVGVESTCEVFDLVLTDYRVTDAALGLLKAASVVDLMPIAGRYLEPHAAPASVAYPISRYEAHLAVPAVDLAVPASITVVRKGKCKTYDPADYLRFLGASADEEDLLTFELEAKPTGSLRPDVLLHAILEHNKAPDARVLSLTRIAQKTLDGMSVI